MKKNFTLRMVAWLVGAVLASPVLAQENDQTSVTETVYVAHDVSLRLSQGDKANSTDGSLEMKISKTDDEVSDRLVGLMSFNLPAKAGYVVTSAKLRLVTERTKGTMDVYAFGGTVSDADTYNSQKDNIEAALATAKLYSAKLNGTNNKATFDSGASSNLQDWVNTIDLTSTVQQTSGTLALLLASESTNGSRVYSSDATDAQNVTKSDDGTETVNFTFAAADLKPVLTIVYEKDADAKSNASTSTADTWIRLNNKNTHGTETTMEIASKNKEDGTVANQFLGLMAFEIPEEALQPNHEIESVTLRLVSERVKGDRTINIYGYPATFEENTTFETEEENIKTALTTNNLIATFEAKGQAASMSSDNLQDAYKTVDAWTNTIDLTNYVKKLTSNKFGIVIEKPNSSNTNQNAKFFTKEATDVTNAKDNTLTFAAADLKPLLTINYKKASYELSVASIGAATLVLPYESTIPEGATVYTLTDAGNSKALATEVSGTLPANTPVLVSAEEGKYTFKATSTATTKSDNPVSGMLTGVWEKTNVPEGSYILWADNTHDLGFYKTTSTAKATVEANHAYLTAGTSSDSKIDISFGETDGIGSIEAATADNRIYTLSGVRVSQPLQKGIYIQNGKKFIVK